jgi:hypothetical protein
VDSALYFVADDYCVAGLKANLLRSESTLTVKAEYLGLQTIVNQVVWPIARMLTVGTG